MENIERKTIVEVRGLSKQYGNFYALKDLDLSIKEGEIVGLVGKNGAGKTTLIRLIAGLIEPTSGTMSLFGENDKSKLTRMRGGIAAMVETPALYLNMNAHDNLMTRCILENMPKEGLEQYIKDRLEYVGLGDYYKSSKKVKDFSLGMRQRIGIAMALTGDPKLLILDEPTNGLDPEGIKQIRELLQKINKEQGATIIVSSHILSELGKFATSYVFLDQGEKIKEATEQELESNGGKIIKITAKDNKKACKALTDLKYEYVEKDDTIIISNVNNVAEAINKMAKAGIEFVSFKEESSDLEQFFVDLLEELK